MCDAKERKSFNIREKNKDIKMARERMRISEEGRKRKIWEKGEREKTIAKERMRVSTPRRE